MEGSRNRKEAEAELGKCGRGQQRSSDNQLVWGSFGHFKGISLA